jgi:hypothetical protein
MLMKGNCITSSILQCDEMEKNPMKILEYFIIMEKLSKTILLAVFVCAGSLWGGASQGLAQSLSSVPQWAQNAVWYQVFAERFRNGDPANEPTPQHIHAPDAWQLTPWTSDWYQRADWEQHVGPGFYSFVNDRRYGGIR